jgi:FAD/FMN-containing dehydrogenase/Fe-S oxidoreductase
MTMDIRQALSRRRGQSQSSGAHVPRPDLDGADGRAPLRTISHAEPARDGQDGRAARTARTDIRGLRQALRDQIAGEVRFDAGSRALYATDASHYRQTPLGVVIPCDEDALVQTIDLCHRFHAPVVLRGGGTSLAGQGCNAAVVIDCSKYLHRIIDLDPHSRRAVVQPGVILDTLRDAAERFHLTFGPDPATHNRCTLGGMLGNNSCGVHSVMAGRTSDNVEELEILTYDGLRLTVGATSNDELARIIAAGGRRGEIYARMRALRDRYADEIRRRYPHIPRRISGYNLDELLPEKGFNVARALVGSESTLVTILKATVRLVPSPPARALLVLGYRDGYTAADHVPQIMARQPIGLEGFDHTLVQDMQRKGLHPQDVALLPPGGGWLMVEFGGETPQEAADKAQALMAELHRRQDHPSMKLFIKPAEAHKIWQVREAALAATAFVPGKPMAWAGWEDSAVPPEKLGDYLRDLRRLMNEFGYQATIYGHFGQGCVHTRIDFDFTTAEGIERYDAFVHRAAEIVVGYGGSLSGEHGDGQSRAELLPIMFGEKLMDAFREFKAIWDPEGRMNPGKVIDAYGLTENLRQGADYHPLRVKTYFQYPEDGGSFAHATLRCVGVGKCRHLDGGTMCPSFMVTREEKDTTRGRAHLLFEMLRGDPLTGKWRAEAVKDALDLCLACKGCKSDCPVNVDMATYKAEFLAHYYRSHPRPRSAYTMGLIHWWARLAAIAPGVVNSVTHAPALSRMVKALGGVAPQRDMPRFAPETFKQWFRRHAPRNVGSPQVILWADTFNNHFHPEVAIAAVDVLERAGFQVVVPEAALCCGRPLYDFGFLDQARDMLKQIMATLREQIRAGLPIVGLEPSCVAVFRDELPNLFPDDPDAARLKEQSFLLSEFLTKHAPDVALPLLHRRAIVHGHCHHKAIMKLTDEEAVLKRLGLDYTIPDDGCCGMAGAFGFEQGDHYEVAQKAGERVLLPAVRQAANDTLIVADGFSCREQIRQNSHRQALHLAQVIQMALAQGPHGPAGELPEAAYTRQHVPPQHVQRRRALVGAGMAGAALAIASAALALARLQKPRSRKRQLKRR